MNLHPISAITPHRSAAPRLCQLAEAELISECSGVQCVRHVGLVGKHKHLGVAQLVAGHQRLKLLPRLYGVNSRSMSIVTVN